jgi:hypothetical protein
MVTAAASEPAPSATAETPPSADLLLYLGEFEDAAGDFVDPMALPETEELALDDVASDAAPTEDDDRDDPQRFR